MKMTNKKGTTEMTKTMLAAALMAALAVFSVGADPVEQTGKTIVVTGVADVTVTNVEFEVDVASGGNATIDPAYPVMVRAQTGGSVTLRGDAWRDKVALWLDASEAWTLEAARNKSGAVQTINDGGTTALITRWRDRRPEQTEWIGFNCRGVGTDTGVYNGVYPYVISNGCNGLTYVTCGNLANFGRRMPFIKVVNGEEMITVNGNGVGNGLENDSYYLDVKYVIMAFGSQRGGGNAVAGRLVRATTGTSVAAGTGIFAANRSTRLDGAEVDPTATGFNAGWQILSFAPNSGEKVAGLGLGAGSGTYGSYYGGQNYAEVLVFTNKPTACEFATVEKYLANKWGISTYATSDAESETRLFGDGTATVSSGTVRLGGEFSGTMTVAEGATLQLTDTATAPTNPVSGMTGWYDPDRTDKWTSTAATVNGESIKRVDTLYNLGAGQDGKTFNLIAASRGPRIMRDTRGWGSARYWCDYHKDHTGGTGNTLRMNDSTDGTANSLATRTGFMVLDTSEGGGTPFLDTSVYSFNGTINSQYVMARVPSSPIFRTQTGYDKGSYPFSPAEDAYVVTNSPAFLDGAAVNSGKHTYNARPELLSFTFSKDIPIRCVGSWQQESAYASSIGLRHGEIILYPTALSDADRKATEAYLMKKWLGKTPVGYGDPSQMTVSGAGTVTTANGVLRPKTSAAFAGTLSVPGDSLTFSIDTTAETPVADAILMPNGTLVTADDLTIDVVFSKRPAAGVYTLVTAGSWNATTVTMGHATGAISAKRASLLQLRRSANALLLEVKDVGFILSVR